MSVSNRPAHPFLMPTVSYPSVLAFVTAALIAAFSPGASPPPTSMPIFILCASVCRVVSVFLSLKVDCGGLVVVLILCSVCL